MLHAGWLLPDVTPTIFGMHQSTRNTNISLGFITVRHHPELGFLGGYLILNELTRPLEFHCTAPVLPNRTQQILYGKALTEFVCGEQIARAMVSKAKCTPDLVFTDTSSILTLRYVATIPLGAIDVEHHESRLAHPEICRSDFFRFQVGDYHMHCLNEHRADADKMREIMDSVKAPLDLIEPFGRIEEALMEAHPNSKAA